MVYHERKAQASTATSTEGERELMHREPRDQKKYPCKRSVHRE